VRLLPHATVAAETPRTVGVAASDISNTQPPSTSQRACPPFVASETVKTCELGDPKAGGGVGFTRQSTEEALAEIREQPSCLGSGVWDPKRVTVRVWKAEVGKPRPRRVSTVPPAGSICVCICVCVCAGSVSVQKVFFASICFSGVFGVEMSSGGFYCVCCWQEDCKIAPMNVR
jgi:hypothetical protein